MVGAHVAEVLRDSIKTRWPLSFAPGFYFFAGFLVFLALHWPEFLPYRLQPYIPAAVGTSVPLVIGMLVVMVLVFLGIQWRLWRREEFLFAATCMGFTLFMLCAEPIVATVALHRSSKHLAEKAASFIRGEDQLVIFEEYLSSLPFYLNIQRPIWVVWSGTKSKVLGSDYVAQRLPKPVAGYGQVLFNFEEFVEHWRTSKDRFVVFVDNGALHRFEKLTGTQPRILFQFRDTVVVENKESQHS